MAWPKAMQNASLITLPSTAAIAGLRMWVLAASPLGTGQ